MGDRIRFPLHNFDRAQGADDNNCTNASPTGRATTSDLAEPRRRRSDHPAARVRPWWSRRFLSYCIQRGAYDRNGDIAIVTIRPIGTAPRLADSPQPSVRIALASGVNWRTIWYPKVVPGPATLGRDGPMI
jgi:hypothetical protein